MKKIIVIAISSLFAQMAHAEVDIPSAVKAALAAQEKAESEKNAKVKLEAPKETKEVVKTVEKKVVKPEVIKKNEEPIKVISSTSITSTNNIESKKVALKNIQPEIIKSPEVSTSVITEVKHTDIKNVEVKNNKQVKTLKTPETTPDTKVALLTEKNIEKKSEVVSQEAVVEKKTVKKVIKKKAVRKVPTTKKVIVKPVDSITLVAKPAMNVRLISYADTHGAIKVISSEDGTAMLSASLVNNNNDALDINKLVAINGSQLQTTIVNTDLSSALRSDFKGQTSISQTLSSNKCKAIYLTYQLKSEKEAKTIYTFLDANGQQSNSVDSACTKKVASVQEDTYYTKSSKIVDISFNKVYGNKGIIAYNIHTTEEGKEIIPHNLRSFIVSRDFTKMYHPSPSNKRGAYYGVEFKQPATSGSYYVLFGLDDTKSTEWFTSESSLP